MNHDAYDRIIDRYLTGQMKPEEEREFQELLKVDPDLKALFSAETVVGRVLTHDRETLPAERPEAYAHFLGLLATSVPAAQQMAASKSAATSAAKTTAVGKGAAGAAAVGKSTILGSILAGGAVKAIVGAVAIVGVAAGTYFGVPALRSSSTASAVEQQVGKAPVSSPSLRGSDLPAEPATSVSPASPEVSAPTSQQQPKVEPREDAPRRTAAHASNESPAQVQASPLVGAPSVTVQADRPEAQQQLPRMLRRLKNDTVRAPIKVNSNVKSGD